MVQNLRSKYAQSLDWRFEELLVKSRAYARAYVRAYVRTYARAYARV